MNSKQLYHPFFWMGCLLWFSSDLLAQAPVQHDQHSGTDVIAYIQTADQFQEADSAAHYLGKAIKLSRKIGFMEGLVSALLKRAAIDQKRNQASSALLYCLEALSHAQKEQNSKAATEALLMIGDIYSKENLQGKALEYFQQAAQITPDDRSLQHLIGQTYARLNQPDSAILYYNTIYQHHRSNGNRAGTISLLQDLIDLYNRQANYRKSLDANFEILELLGQNSKEEQLAIIHNNIGYNYNFLDQYDQAIEHFQLSADYCKDQPFVDLAALYTNLAVAYHNKGNTEKAVKFLQIAKRHLPKDQKAEACRIDNLISVIHLNDGNLYDALRYNELAVENGEANHLHRPLSKAYEQGALIYQQFYDYELALDYYQRFLDLRDSFRLEERLRQQELLQQQYLLERTEKEIKLLLIDQDLQKLTINQLELEKAKLKLESDNLRLETQTREDELALLRRQQEVEQANLLNKELEAERTRQELNLAEQRLLAEQQNRQILNLQRLEEQKELELANQRLTLAEKEKEELENAQKIQLLETEKMSQQMEIERQEAFRNLTYWLMSLLSLILLMILSGLLYFRRANKKLSEQNVQIESQKEEIELERNKSEQLLLNILPEQTANELKARGVATPKKYEQVTVMFTDFSGFTRISADMPPDVLIEELNFCFKTFDEIAERHQLEKIKTIGDSYMCAGGIPSPNQTNAEDAVRAALEMCAFMQQRYVEMIQQGHPYWHMRVGIHTGQVIAGVVGIKKFIYDIWGDTVNTASRLERACLDNKINISGETYALIKDQFECTYRGEVDVKNKGLIKMYFVEQNGREV